MAIYHFHLKKVSKSKGINGKALKHAKYILREDEYENCFTISDKARCIAGGVIEAIFYLKGHRNDLS